MYRDNLVHANPNIEPSTGPGGVVFPGSSARDRDSDPFAVLGNREARSAEVFLTYDPTGASFFYNWDNDYAEDARFAFNIGGNYTEYPTYTDANQFFFTPTGTNASFGVGLPAEDVWSVSSRMVFNPHNRLKHIWNLKTGFQQSTGDPTGGTRKFYEVMGKIVIANKHIIEGYVKKDAWGPYDFNRQFNEVFPEQYKVDYSMILDGSGHQVAKTAGSGTRIGVRALYRRFDLSPEADPLQQLVNDYIFQTVFYFTYMF